MAFAFFVFASLLICQFHRCASKSFDNLSEDDKQKYELTKLSNEEVSKLVSEATCSKACFVYTAACYKQHATTEYKFGEPYKVVKDEAGDDFCFECLTTGYSTLKLYKSMKIAPIPPIPGYNIHEPNEEGMLYDFQLKFGQIRTQCFGCKFPTPTGREVKGNFTSLWSTPVVEVVAYKRIWYGSYVRYHNVTTVKAIKPSDLPLECNGNEEFQKICKQLHAQGKLDTKIDQAILQLLPTRLNKAEEDEFYKGNRALLWSIHKVFGCNTVQVSSEEEEQCEIQIKNLEN